MIQKKYTFSQSSWKTTKLSRPPEKVRSLLPKGKISKGESSFERKGRRWITGYHTYRYLSSALRSYTYSKTKSLSPSHAMKNYPNVFSKKEVSQVAIGEKKKILHKTTP